MRAEDYLFFSTRNNTTLSIFNFILYKIPLRLQFNTYTLNKVKCPHCGKNQNQQSIKNWKYGASVAVSRYKCICGKLFNHYKSSKKSWTIPKNMESNESS